MFGENLLKALRLQVVNNSRGREYNQPFANNRRDLVLALFVSAIEFGLFKRLGLSGEIPTTNQHLFYTTLRTRLQELFFSYCLVFELSYWHPDHQQGLAATKESIAAALGGR